MSRLRPTVKYVTMDYFDFLIKEVKSGRRLTVYDSEGIGSPLYGLTVFDDEYWLWKGIEKPFGLVEIVVVRRDAASREVIDAVLEDDRIMRLLGEGARQFERVIVEYEEVLTRAGYGDIVEKVKAIVTLSLLLA